MSKNENFNEDKRFAQCTKEMWATLGLFVVNVILVGGISLAMGSHKSAASMTYIFGFPAWFFWGGIVGTGIFCILPYVMIKLFFKDMSIEAEDER